MHSHGCRTKQNVLANGPARLRMSTIVGSRSGEFPTTTSRQGEKTTAGSHQARQTCAHDRTGNRNSCCGKRNDGRQALATLN